MQFLRFRETPASGELRIYPFVCWHRGVKESNLGFIKEMVQRVADDEDARWIMLGDLGDCVTRHSKGDLFSQTIPPQLQMEEVVDLLEPVKGKGLFGVEGNHGARIYRETGMTFDKTLCTLLGIPYAGISAFVDLRVYDTRYDVYVRHGLTSGATMGGKVKRAIDADSGILADAVLTAHSHIAGEIEPETMAYLPAQGNSVKWRTKRRYICGSSYDSRTGYAESKGYSPIIPAHVCVGFRGWERGTAKVARGVKEQSFTVYRVDPNAK